MINQTIMTATNMLSFLLFLHVAGSLLVAVQGYTIDDAPDAGIDGVESQDDLLNYLDYLQLRNANLPGVGESSPVQK